MNNYEQNSGIYSSKSGKFAADRVLFDFFKVPFQEPVDDADFRRLKQKS